MRNQKFLTLLITFCITTVILISFAFGGLFAYGFFTGLSESLTDSPSPEHIPVNPVNTTQIPSVFDEFNESKKSQSIPSSSEENFVSSSKYYTRTHTWNYNGYDQSFTLSIPKEHYEYYRNKSHSGRNYDYYALSEHDRQLLGIMIEYFKNMVIKMGLQMIKLL